MSAILARRGAISEGMPGPEIPSKAEIDAIISKRPVSADQSQDGVSASSSVSRGSPVADWADRYHLTRRGPNMRNIGGISPTSLTDCLLVDIRCWVGS